jgi:hypothetical protein
VSARTKVVALRLTKAELREWKAMAKRQGRTLSSFVRTKCNQVVSVKPGEWKVRL